MARQFFPKQLKHRAIEAKNGFLLLMISLFAMLLIPSLFDKDSTPVLNSVALGLVLLTALYLIAHNKNELIIGLLLAIPSILTNWWVGMFPHHAATIAHYVLSVIFLLYISFHIFRYLFATRDVSLNMLYAAVCLYMMIGIIWGMIYVVLQLFNPGSFQLDPTHVRHELILTEMLYFSYVTITTLGYGDIVPLTRLARILSSFEAIIGQFYLAFVVARLVGLYITGNKQD